MHPETRKGVVIDEMLRGVENKHRFGEFRIGQPFELLLNPWVGKRQPGELKHVSSQWKRKQKCFRCSDERNGSSLNLRIFQYL